MVEKILSIKAIVTKVPRDGRHYPASSTGQSRISVASAYGDSKLNAKRANISGRQIDARGHSTTAKLSKSDLQQTVPYNATQSTPQHNWQDRSTLHRGELMLRGQHSDNGFAYSSQQTLSAPSRKRSQNDDPYVVRLLSSGSKLSTGVKMSALPQQKKRKRSVLQPIKLDKSMQLQPIVAFVNLATGVIVTKLEANTKLEEGKRSQNTIPLWRRLRAKILSVVRLKLASKLRQAQVLMQFFSTVQEDYMRGKLTS